MKWVLGGILSLFLSVSFAVDNSAFTAKYYGLLSGK